MTQEKHYNYYRFESSSLSKQYDDSVGEERKRILSDLLSSTGAVAYTASSSWGGQEVVRELVFPFDTDLKNEPHIKTVRSDRYDGQRVVILDGKRNRKLGVQFNKPVVDANEALKDLPDFRAWVISELKVGRTGLGGAHESGRGVSMLSTDFGMSGDIYYFRIPNVESNGASEKVLIPEGFERLSYGQWYDLINNTGE